MASTADVLQQVSMAAYALAGAIGQATSPPGAPAPGYVPYGPQSAYPPAYYPPSAPMPADRVSWGTFAAPPVPPAPPAAPAPTGFMAVLESAFSAIVNFFRRLFGGAPASGAASYAPPGQAYPGNPALAYPAVNPDARAQVFQMFPTGNGLALGFVPVSSQRTGNSIVVSAAGFGQARVYWQGDQAYFQQNQDQPRRVDRVVSTRQPSGDTRFDITLEGGKAVAADILADGRTLRYQGYTVTLG